MVGSNTRNICAIIASPWCGGCDMTVLGNLPFSRELRRVWNDYLVHLSFQGCGPRKNSSMCDL